MGAGGVWCVKGRGTCFHLPFPAAVIALVSLLGQIRVPWLCVCWCPRVGGQNCCCVSPSFAPGPPAAGATASLHGHE